MQSLLAFLGTVFGFKAGTTVANAAVGVVNWGALGAGAVYVLNHSDQQIPLGSISLGALGLVLVGVFVVIELLRRGAPGAGGN